MLEFPRVWDHIKPIIRNKIDKCSEHNLKIGPLRTYTFDDIVAIYLLQREVAPKPPSVGSLWIFSGTTQYTFMYKHNYQMRSFPYPPFKREIVSK